jgi:hypothetical protein
MIAPSTEPTPTSAFAAVLSSCNVRGTSVSHRRLGTFCTLAVKEAQILFTRETVYGIGKEKRSSSCHATWIGSKTARADVILMMFDTVKVENWEFPAFSVPMKDVITYSYTAVYENVLISFNIVGKDRVTRARA